VVEGIEVFLRRRRGRIVVEQWLRGPRTPRRSRRVRVSLVRASRHRVRPATSRYEPVPRRGGYAFVTAVAARGAAMKLIASATTRAMMPPI
jgi:hypothetical protein